MTAPKNPAPILKTANQARHLALLGLFAMTASSPAQETVFGTDHQGYGDFTSDFTVTAPATVPGWTELADSVQFGNDGTSNTGFVNSSLLKEYNLSRADGSSATITGVIDIVSTYAADNNRFGITLFATSDGIAGADSGLSLQHNVGNGQFRILASGVNGAGGILNVNANYLGLNFADAIGTTFTYRADIAFVGANIEIDFTLTDQNDFSQTLSTTVAAADFPGGYFGFSTRGRVRNNNPGVNDIPFIYDAKTFSVVEIPAPVSGPPVLVITPNTTTPGNYDFTWTSKAGKVYDLVSSTDLATSISTWPVWDDRSVLHATPPENVLANVPGSGDTRRFFAVVERDFFAETFDGAAALPAGWSSNGPGNGTNWEVGQPSGVPSGPATAFTEPHCAGTNIGGYYTENANVSLLTPVITIPADRSATLRFRQFIDTDGVGDFGAVRILDADQSNAPIAGLEITNIDGLGNEWTQNSLAMPANAVGGRNIRIEFHFSSNAGAIQDTDVYSGFYVDDVFVTLDSTN